MRQRSKTGAPGATPAGHIAHTRVPRGGPRAAALLGGALALLAASASGCGSSSSGSTTGASSASVAATSPPATSPPVTTPAASTTATTGGGGLSGTWSGQYSGAYQGTFKLEWRQTGASLDGKIALSTPPSRLSVNGSLAGSSIRFGTVGSVAITYSGSVSGSSMSGSYQVAGQRGGSWSASRSS